MKKVERDPFTGRRRGKPGHGRNSQAKGSPLDQPLESFSAEEGNLSGKRTEVLSIG